MATHLPKYTHSLKKTKLLSLWATIVIAANALFFLLIANNLIELGFAIALSAMLATLMWLIFHQLNQAAKDFQAKDEQMQFIFQSVPIGLHWSYHREERNSVVADERLFNPAHSKITGLTREEMDTPGSFAAITHPEDLKKQIEIRKLLADRRKSEVSMEKRYLRNDGSFAWVNASWKREYDEDDKGYKEISCIVDITASKEANESLRRKEAQLRVIFESVPIGLLWSDVEVPDDVNDKHFLERIVNPAHNKLTGMNKERAKQPRIYDQISFAEDMAVQKKGISETIDRADGSFSMDKRYKHPDGSVIWVSITWLRRWDKSMKRYQEISTLVDITGQKQFARDIEQAKIAAEEANRSKSQFLATMSHEIRTPMNGMIGMMHIMEPNLDSENLKYLKIAQNSADDLLELINDILDFSKIEAGKMEFENRDFPIDEFIEQATEIHAKNAFEKGLDIHCSIEPEAAIEIYGDPHKLRQVLSNLMSNAVKFTERGAIVLGARRILKGKVRESLEIYVQDTGIGISEEAKKNLFQPFTQANASTTRKYGGTGLGLSICKRIVEHMQGEIGVDSDENRGSRFWIRIPCKERDPLPELLSPNAKNGPTRAIAIDRCSNSSSHLSAWLRQWGCETLVIQNLEQLQCSLREAATDTKFDLVIIDASILSTQAVEWQKTIADEPALSGAKTILIQRLLNNRIREAPDFVDQILTKPLRIRQMIDVFFPKEEKRQAPQPNQPSKHLNSINLNDTKVLVVDDNITNRLIVTKLLAHRHGIEADTANNGLEAIDRIKEKRYDIVLMDCMMPEMDGYDATRAIRNGEAGNQNRDLPIIALTANATLDDQAQCIAAGMNDHASKPIGPAQIKDVLVKWAGKNDPRH